MSIKAEKLSLKNCYKQRWIRYINQHVAFDLTLKKSLNPKLESFI